MKVTDYSTRTNMVSLLGSIPLSQQGHAPNLYGRSLAYPLSYALAPNLYRVFCIVSLLAV